MAVEVGSDQRQVLRLISLALYQRSYLLSTLVSLLKMTICKIPEIAKHTKNAKLSTTQVISQEAPLRNGITSPTQNLLMITEQIPPQCSSPITQL